MAAKIRVGVVGAGFIGAVHARAYRHVADVELAGVADPAEERTEALAREAGCRRFHSYEALLEAGIDIISVCLPPTSICPPPKPLPWQVCMC